MQAIGDEPRNDVGRGAGRRRPVLRGTDQCPGKKNYGRRHFFYQVPLHAFPASLCGRIMPKLTNEAERESRACHDETKAALEFR